MKMTVLLTALAITAGSCMNSSAKPSHEAPPITQETPATPTKKPSVPERSSADNTLIQVALLLDTSNSMDGLIEQAKSRLWNIINTLTTLKYQGKEPRLEIALYEYGNDGLSQTSNYIRQVTPLTTDLDLISEKLFALRTNGGSEFCGAVISESLKKLSWATGKADMKLIYIAGNEEFNQGGISYKESVASALQKDIFVNTIYCGDRQTGIRELWKDGADKGGGKYFNIDSDKAVAFIETPYDTQIEACDIRLNNTYISYGKVGDAKKANQLRQDSNAKSLNKANYIERSVSKSKTAYKNESWDLVDRVKEDQTALTKISQEELPKELKGKSKTEMEAYVLAKSKERTEIQKEMSELSKKRQTYIDEQQKKATPGADDLGTAINVSIMEVAKRKGYVTQ